MTGKRPLDTVSYAAIANARKGARSKTVDIACPICGPQHEGASAKRKIMRTWTLGDDRISLHCVRCGVEGWIVPDGGTVQRSETRPDCDSVSADADEERERQRKLEAAARIWRQSCSIAGTAGEVYFNRRKIDLAVVPDYGGLRFHPRCPWNGNGTIRDQPGTLPRAAQHRDAHTAGRQRRQRRRPGGGSGMRAPLDRRRPRSHPPDAEDGRRRFQRHRHSEGERGMSDPYTGTFDELTGEQNRAGANGGTAATTGLGEWNAALDIEPPPPRGWLLGVTFCRTFLSSILGTGGVGKTALRYAQALSLATGRELTGEHVFQRCRVLIVSLEDDDRELRRRIRAARLHYNIPLSELDGWLWLAAPGKKAGKLMEMDKKGRAAVIGKLAANIEAVVVARNIDLVMLDPFVKTHSVEENLNSAIDDVAQTLTDLATKHNIAVDAPHHVRKGQMTPGDAEAGRGASSLNAAARLVNTCLPMNEDEAQTFGISQEDRRSYIRVDSGKTNIAKPTRNATWFHLVNVPLDNATELYPAGDQVQTVEPWEPPKTWADLSDDDIERALVIIDAGLSDGNLYSDANSATTRAAWKVVKSVMPEKTETQCREIIRTWVKNEVLIKAPYTNPKNRKEERGLKLDPQKREEMDNRDRARRRKAEAASRGPDMRVDLDEHGIPFMVTAAQKQKLRELGFAECDIREMTPVQVQDILKRDAEKGQD
jgi:AAA domain